MLEMNRDNIRIHPDLDINDERNTPCINAHIEMWFNVDEKFGTHTREREDIWINLYASYSPVYHTLQLEYFIESDDSVSDPIPYEPTESERETIMEMIEKKCREVNGCSCAKILRRNNNEKNLLGQAWKFCQRIYGLLCGHTGAEAVRRRG